MRFCIQAHYWSRKGIAADHCQTAQARDWSREGSEGVKDKKMSGGVKCMEYLFNPFDTLPNQ